MGKNIIFIGLVLILMISLVGAETFKKDDTVNIDHSVRFGDAPTSSALCNITLWNPLNTRLVDFKSMTYNSDSQTYNYSISNTSELGEYRYDITCSQEGLNKTDSFAFEINPSGKEYSTAQSITYFFLFILSIFFFILFLFMAVKIEWTNETTQDGQIININYKKYLKPFAFVLAYGSLIVMAYMAWDISAGVLNFNGLGFFFYLVSRFLLGLAAPIMIVAIIISVMTFFRDKNLEKMIGEGFMVNRDV